MYNISMYVVCCISNIYAGYCIFSKSIYYVFLSFLFPQ